MSERERSVAMTNRRDSTEGGFEFEVTASDRAVMRAGDLVETLAELVQSPATNWNEIERKAEELRRHASHSRPKQ